MTELSRQRDLEDLRPNRITFKTCLVASARQVTVDDTGALTSAEDLIHLMEDTPGMHPDTECYNILLDIYSKGSAPDRANRARNLLHRMKERYLDKGYLDTKPNVKSHTFVIRSCRALDSTKGAPDESMIEVALKSMKECRESSAIIGEGPDSALYASLFKCLQSHFGVDPSTSSQVGLVSDTFEMCCEEGQVSSSVLSIVKEFNEGRLLMDATPGGIVSHKPEDYPVEWSRNA
jgi:hypothetical protein